MGKESICCGTALWSEVDGAKCVMNFAELQEALETDCPVSPESVLPIAHYWLKRVSHIDTTRAQEFTLANFLMWICLMTRDICKILRSN